MQDYNAFYESEMATSEISSAFAIQTNIIWDDPYMYDEESFIS